MIIDASTITRENYLVRVTMGGYPSAIGRSEVSRDRWSDDYVRLTLERDIRQLSNIRQIAAMPKLFQNIVSQNGQVVNIIKAATAARKVTCAC